MQNKIIISFIYTFLGLILFNCSNKKDDPIVKVVPVSNLIQKKTSSPNYIYNIFSREDSINIYFDSIIVVDADSRKIQSISLDDNNEWGPLEVNKHSELPVYFEDVNFDSYSDLLLSYGQGAMGRNDFSAVYLFDSLQNKFQYNETFSNICNLRINQKDQTIEEFIFNGGDPNYTFTTYEIVNKALVIKKIINQHFDTIETTYYQNGKFLSKEIETVKNK